MTVALNLHDIQGNIVKGYGRFGFPFARYIFFCVKEEKAGRQFVLGLVPLITTAVAWKAKGDTGEGIEKPAATTNVAFTYHGLKCLGLPEVSLHSFPEDFSMGMRGRHSILGDDGKSAIEYWDPVWRSEDRMAMMVSINGETKDAIEERYKDIQKLLKAAKGGVIQLAGHRGDNGAENLPYQEASAIFEHGKPVPKEHFGYVDGISNPFYKGTGQNPAYAMGSGKPTRKAPDTIAGWEPLETGEFILGYRDESQELPEAPVPRLLSFNGTFMVYRKLHQNIASFEKFLEEEAAKHPEHNKELIAAKFSGRWRNGAPITTFPTEQEANDYMAELDEAKQKLRQAKGTIEEAIAELKFLKLLSKLVGFNYNEDLEGARCPVGAHIRRCNPRGSLEYGVKDAYNTPGALINRRRIIRRGLPYGDNVDKRDEGNHGIIFMTLGVSIERQFEFVQQQWVNYGNDFKLANEKDALLGNHHTAENGKGDGVMVFPSEPDSGKAPYFCSGIPRFVETRGGEYFFIPSITALTMIGEGTIDPT